jgi:peptidoglycan/LPS O-acetylase OafA/YrhL
MARRETWKLGHRPQLDGVRGIAILLVLVLHWDPFLLPGGRCGVDLFLVLSGFLITSLLVQEFAGSGTIRLRSFWWRRIRRLFPAYVAMLALVWLFVTIRHEGHTGSILWTLGYVANYAPANRLMPELTHTWSLSLEEQFYLVWPPILLLLLRTCKRSIITGLVAFTAALVWLHRLGAQHVAYLHPGATEIRCDGLLFGVLVAFAFSWWGAEHWRAWRYLGVLSLLALVRYVILGADIRYHGGTIVAAAGASLVGVAMTSPTAARILSFGPLRWFGLRAYSLYLWHFPILVALRGRHITSIHAGTSLLAVPLTLLAAEVSYRLVESRFRIHARAIPAPTPPARSGSEPAVDRPDPVT